METANQIIHLYGAGRDVRTKSDRRLNRFQERQFRIGEVVVRPGRRTPVTVEFLAGHLDTVIQHIERGALRLQSTSDSFIDPDELRALVSGAPLPATQATTPAPTGPGEDDLPDDGPIGEEPYEAPADEPPMDEPTDSELASEPEAPIQDAPEEALDLAPLPDAWRTRNKKGLLALCAERKLDASDKLSNRELIEKLEGWEASR